MSAPIVVSDMDGTLTTGSTWRGVHAWIMANHPSGAARRFVPLRMPVVAAVRLGLVDRESFRARWVRDQAGLLRGVGADELAAMGEWVVERHLWPDRRQVAVDAVIAAGAAARALDPSVQVVLATGAFQPIAEAFARRLGATALGTPLEMRDGLATGRLAMEVRYGAKKAAAVRTLAGGGEVLAAFGDSAADIPLLELARRPVAVAPDPALRRAAAERGWEILDLVG